VGALQRVETGASPLPESVSSVSRGAAMRNASTSASTLDSSISLSLRISYMSLMRNPNEKIRNLERLQQLYQLLSLTNNLILLSAAPYSKLLSFRKGGGSMRV
jgi:hypothetical protein